MPSITSWIAGAREDIYIVDRKRIDPRYDMVTAENAWAIPLQVYNLAVEGIRSDLQKGLWQLRIVLGLV